MPWEVSAIKMLWKQSHYLTYQQVHSWCHDDVSSVNQTWQETPEVIMIKRHFQKWRISFFLKIGIFVKRVHPPFTFSEALHVLEFQSPWKMFWVPGCGDGSAAGFCFLKQLYVHFWEIMVCFKDKAMRIQFDSGSAGHPEVSVCEGKCELTMQSPFLILIHQGCENALVALALHPWAWVWLSSDGIFGNSVMWGCESRVRHRQQEFSAFATSLGLLTVVTSWDLMQ